MPEFGLNQSTMSKVPFDAFVDSAVQLGCVGVEARNDLGRPVFDGQSAQEAGRKIRAQGLRLLGLSQVQPFNRWSDEIAAATQALIETAAIAGAESISLIPSNDGSGLDPDTRHNDLMRALEGCLPMLEDANLTALVEPLGFSTSSLRSKSQLATAIDALGAGDRIKMVHDTFHHTLGAGTEIYPARTGIVHISGVSVPEIAISDLEDHHRALVDDQDRLNNLDQIVTLLDAGYTGVFSFECFAPEVQALIAPGDAIRASISFISSHLRRRAA